MIFSAQIEFFLDRSKTMEKVYGKLINIILNIIIKFFKPYQEFYPPRFEAFLANYPLAFYKASYRNYFSCLLLVLKIELVNTIHLNTTKFLENNNDIYFRINKHTLSKP